MTTESRGQRPDSETSQPRSEGPDADEVTYPYQRIPVRRIGKALGTVLLVAVLVPFLLFAVPQVAGADHSFVILSGSMEPELSPGDVILVSDSASVQVGDVITFTGSTVPVTHRVIGVEDGQYITKGDANENADSAPVPPGNVLGRVVVTMPYVGYVILWANTPVGQIALVVGPLLALGLSFLYGWSKEGGDEEAGTAVDAGGAVETAADDGGPTDLESLFESVGETPRASTTVDGSLTGSVAVGEPAPDSAVVDVDTVAVTAPDLKLTLVATAALAGYAAWNVYREVAAFGAPEPASVGVLTAGLLGMSFALWATYSARRSRPAPAPTERPAVDGGAEMEGSE